MAHRARRSRRRVRPAHRITAVTTVLVVVTAALLTLLAGAAAAAPQPPTPTPPPTAPADPCQVAPGQPRPPQCIPQPSVPPGTPGAPAAPAGPQPPSGVGGWITSAISAAIEWFFRQLITSALNPLMDLIGRTLLSTPTPDEQPRLGELWNGTRLIAISAYVLLVMIGGIVLMGHETVQSRHSAKEIAPRIVLGFLAMNLSLWIAGVCAGLANALARAVLGGAVDPDTGAVAMRELVTNAMDNGGGLWLVFIGLALIVMVVVLVITYVIRIAMFAILIVAAPLALACHALPQTEGIAYWWWRAFGALLAIQLGQSLTLAVALRVFFTPGGFRLFGDGAADGWVNLFLCLALLIILIKIPFWMLSAVKVSKSRSMAGTVVRAFLAYKAFGLIRGGAGRLGALFTGAGSGSGGPAGPPDPYAKARTTRDGQYLLPLGQLRRTRRAAAPGSPAVGLRSTGGAASRGGEQLALPLGGYWPEDTPVLGRDGQYRLPIEVKRVPRTAPPPPPVTPRPPSARQLRFPPSGQWPEHTPVLGRDGQYRLPMDVKRVPRTPPPPPPPAVRRPRGQQLRFPPDGVWPPERRPRRPGGQP